MDVYDFNPTSAPPAPAHAAADDQYVDTEAAKAAVLNREAELIAALGLSEAADRHIMCPMIRRHTDHNPSFRWDQAKRKAFCTCIPNWHPRGFGSINIWDLIGEIKGLTFSGAKVWAMQQLGQHDRIRTKGKGGKGKSHGETVADLLAPPAHLRDDNIVAAYLKFRLGGVDPLRPTTPIAGWRSLGYYDPPAAGSKQSTKVGEWPCGVFGTCDVDGAVHAHRIYLGPGGAGKADLPPLPNGNPREVKKSAPAKGSHTSGLGVVWGNLATATWIIVGEGIETMASVAVAFTAELKAGLAVVSAISDSGVAAFRPGPNCQRVIVAADRDDTKNKAGEKAARRLCTAQNPKLAMGANYALPGDPGTDCDWLDVFVAFGAEAVRSGILGAYKFEPTTDDIKEAVKTELPLDPKWDDDGNYRPIHTNGIILLGKLLGDRLGVDIFRQKVTCNDDPPFPWNKKSDDPLLEREIDDAFARACLIYLQNENCFIRSMPMTDQILDELARRRTYNSLQDYLATCVLAPGPWPCTIDTFFELVLGVGVPDEHPDKEKHHRWVRAESGNFFKRLVKRAREPGVKADEAVNVVGPEGLGKSTVFRKLTEPWFSDQLPSMKNKDSQIQIAGIWCLEIGDGSHLARTHADDVKNFLSAPIDRYRGVHARRAEDHPRTTVFVVTSNDLENLLSDHGNRRLPTMESTFARPDLVTAELRAQLFAEAKEALDRGEKHYLTDPELVEYAAGVARDHLERGANDDEIEAFLNKQSDSVAIRLGDVFDELCVTDRARRDAMKRSITKVLRRCGWDNKAVWIDGKTVRRWKRKV